jgi:putative RNA 2'-phosphotransferase
MNDKIVRASKFMSLVLRHRPEKIGLTLDANGWAKVSDLIACSRQGRVPLSLELIREVVETNDKKRYVLSEDGERIRAAQGHSIEVDLDLVPQEPPERLYHGAPSQAVASIREQGLLRGRRHHVHLSLDQETAWKVGQRRGRPVILTVHAGKMRQAGIAFYCSANGVWLTDHVAPEYIVFPEEERKNDRPGRQITG